MTNNYQHMEIYVTNLLLFLSLSSWKGEQMVQFKDKCCECLPVTSKSFSDKIERLINAIKRI